MLRVLRHRDFALLWTGQAMSLIGDGIYLVAIAWLVYDISNSPERARARGRRPGRCRWCSRCSAPGCSATATTAALLMIIADLLRVVAIGGAGCAHARRRRRSCGTWWCWWSCTAWATRSSRPAFTAIVPDVVPQEEILQASALKELMEPVGLRFAGPALGGLLIAVARRGHGPRGGRAHLRGVCRGGEPHVAAAGRRAARARSAWEELREGFAFVRARPWLWATLASAALFLLVSYGPFEVLIPYLIRNELGGGAATFGAVLSAGGLGGITAALLMSRFGAPRRHVTFMYVAWALSAAARPPASRSPARPGSCACSPSWLRR